MGRRIARRATWRTVTRRRLWYHSIGTSAFRRPAIVGLRPDEGTSSSCSTTTCSCSRASSSSWPGRWRATSTQGPRRRFSSSRARRQSTVWGSRRIAPWRDSRAFVGDLGRTQPVLARFSSALPGPQPRIGARPGSTWAGSTKVSWATAKISTSRSGCERRGGVRASQPTRSAFTSGRRHSAPVPPGSGITEDSLEATSSVDMAYIAHGTAFGLLPPRRW